MKGFQFEQIYFNNRTQECFKKYKKLKKSLKQIKQTRASFFVYESLDSSDITDKKHFGKVCILSFQKKEKLSIRLHL